MKITTNSFLSQAAGSGAPSAPRPELAAAGDSVNLGGYRHLSGTSMATPSWSVGLLHMVDEQAALRLDAQEVIESATLNQTSVLEELNKRRPIQDEMPLLFSGENDRDRYFQHRVDDRAQLVQAVQALEAQPGYSGTRTDWSNEKRVDISSLSPEDRSAFYTNLSNLNQAYYGKVIAALT